MTTPAINLTSDERKRAGNLAEQYNAPSEVVGEIYVSIRDTSSPRIAESPFPWILTERELTSRGFKANGYKSI